MSCGFAAGGTRDVTACVSVDCHGHTHIFSGSVAVVRADSAGEIQRAFATIESHLAAGRYAAGYFSYELGYAFERRLLPLLAADRKVPLIWFGIFENCAPQDPAPESLPRAHAGPLAHGWDQARHAAAFEHVHALIEAGDFYQANLSYRARFAFAGDPYALYRELRTRSGARYCAFVDDGERQILSLSPELFFEMSRDGRVRTRPMKGTAARGETAEDDYASTARLLASEKERAENLMIVDLLRNDLSRIAQPGSVVVEKLFEVETYPTVHQLVSTVAATLRPGLRLETIVRALFPCGSVTGAPKLRAMEVIRETETSPRGVYCGAVGHFAPDGSASFNVAIRTLTISGVRGELGIGGAIVHDSQAQAEYAECQIKARFYESARTPLALIETLRFEPVDGFARLSRHLARMASSAAALGLVFDHGRARVALERAIEDASVPLRVRLVLDEEGTFTSGTEPYIPVTQPWRYTISSKRVSSADPLLRHKSSRRELFDAEYALRSNGCDEVLFVNERGELTEGSRTNIFLQMNGALVTPALASGLLDGCLRRELLDEGRCREALLTPENLARADKVYLGNSLRGLIAAAPTCTD